jgi:hypothetical protein
MGPARASDPHEGQARVPCQAVGCRAITMRPRRSEQASTASGWSRRHPPPAPLTVPVHGVPRAAARAPGAATARRSSRRGPRRPRNSEGASRSGPSTAPPTRQPAASSEFRVRWPGGGGLREPVQLTCSALPAKPSAPARLPDTRPLRHNTRLIKSGYPTIKFFGSDKDSPEDYQV